MPFLQLRQNNLHGLYMRIGTINSKVTTTEFGIGICCIFVPAVQIFHSDKYAILKYLKYNKLDIGIGE